MFSSKSGISVIYFRDYCAPPKSLIGKRWSRSLSIRDLLKILQLPNIDITGTHDTVQARELGRESDKTVVILRKLNKDLDSVD
jgi:hypothetical protein